MRQRLLILCLTGILWLSGTITAQPAPVIDEPFIAQMETIIQTANETYAIPGSAVALVQNGEIVYSAGFGVRDLDSGEPMTAETYFRPGSTLKAATAMLIATLVDDGILAWDTPVSDVLPGLVFPEDDLTTELTIAEIMGHGTGLESTTLPWYWNQTTPEDVIAAQATAEISGQRGASYSYNNDLYAIAGYAAVTAADMERDYIEGYATLMQERVFEPIGMTRYVIANDPTAYSENAATAYTINLIRGVDQPDPTGGYLPIDAIVPAGGGVGTVIDIANFLITHLNNGVSPDGTRVVSEENLLRTRAIQNAVAPDGLIYPDFITYQGYAMGWEVLEMGGVTLYTHNGGIDGFLTDMVIIPEANAGMVIMSNSLTGFATNQWILMEFINQLYDLGVMNIQAEIAAILNDQLQGVDMLGPLLANPTVDADAVGPILGDYENGWTVRIDEENILRLDRPGMSLALLPLPGSDVYLIASGQPGLQVVFAEDDTGHMAMTIVAPEGEDTNSRLE